MSATISALFGLTLGWQKSFGRLCGFNENEIEQEKFGISNSVPIATADGDLPVPDTSDDKATAAASA